jgi:hypothetical protein
MQHGKDEMHRSLTTEEVPRAEVARHPRSAGRQRFTVAVADERHLAYAETICAEMEQSAHVRGTGIAKRSPEYLAAKMRDGKAVIALTPEGEWAGFCYIETWSHGRFVANSGLIVAPAFRHSGLARSIKRRIFALSRERHPDAKIFGLTTGLAVMKINSELGYMPVTYSELTSDDDFWAGCQSCVNFPILTAKERKNCLCTAMLYNPEEQAKKGKTARRSFWDFARESQLFDRYQRLKEAAFHALLPGRANGRQS